MAINFRSATIVPDTQADLLANTTSLLMDWKDCGMEFAVVLFHLQNYATVEPCTMIVETSEDAVHADVKAHIIIVPGGRQGSLEVGPYQMRRFWRLKATGGSIGMPISWGLRGCKHST